MLANPDGSSLSLFQTGEATTQKKKYENDVHLIQDEQRFRLHSRSTCLLSLYSSHRGSKQQAL